MLRGIVIAIMSVVTAIAILLAVTSQVGKPWILAVWAIVFLLCLLFERTIYKAELTAPPSPEWVDTGEITVDARGAVRVWYNPRTGERAYVRQTSI